MFESLVADQFLPHAGTGIRGSGLSRYGWAGDTRLARVLGVNLPEGKVKNNAAVMQPRQTSLAQNESPRSSNLLSGTNIIVS